VGATLAVITSDSENTFIKENLVGANYYWVGGERLDGNWKWVTEETWSYTAFDPNNPVKDYEKCLTANQNGWHDWDCTTSHEFICEKPLQ